MLLLLLGACSDYGINPEQKDPGAGLDSALEFGPETGLDSDEEDVCPALPPLPDSTAIDESCDSTPETGELAVRILWGRSDFMEAPEYDQVLTAPLVGQLDDDDGDGDIDRDDIPDIVVVADDNGDDNSDRFGLLAILRGTDGNVTQTIGSVVDGDTEVHPYRYATPALADLDGDHDVEIITLARTTGGGGTEPPPGDTGPQDTDVIDIPDDVPVGPPEPADPNTICVLVAFHVDGTVAWRSSDTFTCAGDMVAVADLDGDGYGEVMAGQAVFDHNGTLLWRASSEARYPAYTEVGMQPVAMDLDVDGQLEVLWGAEVYESDGTLRCAIEEGRDDGFPAVADLDGDGRGEFVLVGDGQARVYQDDCSGASSWVLAGTGNGGPATIADFDGDGEPEIGIADADTYSVYEYGGTVLWSQPITDQSSHATGSSVFDFDGDGRAEVLYGDETTLWVFDGQTGAVRLENHDHTSRTLHELPTVADVDGDGEMEIVVPNGGGHYETQATGMFVLESGGAPWLGDRQVWNQHAYSITNINEDLTLPVPAEPNWPFYNTFRSGSLTSMSGETLPDAIGELQVCTDPCTDGTIGVEIRLANGGMAALRSGVALTLYTEKGVDAYPLATLTSEAELDPGGASDTWHLSLPAADVPEGVLILRVDDAEGVEQVLECHEDNNELRLAGVVCPE